jgi:hypothetical protein
MCVMSDLDRWRKRCAPRLCLDLHAPGAAERDGCYVFAPVGADQTVPPACAAMAERLAAALGGEASPKFMRVATYPSRWPRETHATFSSWAVNRHGLTALSMETSYQGVGDRAFTSDDYRDIGRRLAEALA